jgi:hypothetical protein
MCEVVKRAEHEKKTETNKQTNRKQALPCARGILIWPANDSQAGRTRCAQLQSEVKEGGKLAENENKQKRRQRVRKESKTRYYFEQ